MKPKTYKIKTVNDIVDILTPENVEQFVGDFSKWAAIIAETFDKAYKQIDNKPVKFKRSIDPKDGKWAAMGFMIGTFIGTAAYDQIPQLHKK